MAHILLVEDDPHLAELYREALSQRGHRVSTVANGQEAVERVVDLLPDLILMDIQMPILDGIEATHRLKSSGLADIPIYALTNLQLPEDVSTALDAGCDGYFAKPADPRDLADELALVLEADDEG